MPQPINEFLLDRWLPTVDKPMRYIGNDWNAVHKDWDAVSVHLALAYPDTVEVGMSNIGLQILYDIVNHHPDALCERVFAPWPDMEAVMRARDIPLYALESHHPLDAFEIIGFSLPYELNLTNVLNMLDLAGLAVRAADRGENAPLILGGGSGAYHPEPMADFIDAFVVGEGEQVIVEIIDAFRQTQPGDKTALLKEMARIPGIYVPRFYTVAYSDGNNGRGKLVSIAPNVPEAQMPIVKRVVDPLPPAPTHLVVPYVQPVHDRGVIEIMRGCTQGCRFCQAGMIYRPLRERSRAEVVETANALLCHTGYDEIGLISLSSADHSQIEGIVQDLIGQDRQPPLSVTLPSLRTDAFSVELAQAFQGMRRSGLTFAPEAGSQRLRDVINKKVTADDLLRAAQAAYANNWQRIKLYFMIGLPTETDQDVIAIIDTVKAVLEIGYQHHRKKANVSVTVSTLVPKPHTPFQWHPLIDDETLQRRHQLLKGGLRERGIRFNYHDSRNTLLEAVISRGDRRLGAVIERAWQAGARFDAWNEQFDWPAWENAFAAEGIDPRQEARRERLPDDVLPWAHISCGVDQAYLWREFERATTETTTRDCREGCTNCGAIEQLGCRGGA
ncbi:MAG: TIGR03960 family B12-binding radical SAM protein [Anaerolineae bacterium]|nr:TIGR03960 family B12-binding radical SAM protein [Anaerolineae bacterium]